MTQPNQFMQNAGITTRTESPFDMPKNATHTIVDQALAYAAMLELQTCMATNDPIVEEQSDDYGAQRDKKLVDTTLKEANITRRNLISMAQLHGPDGMLAASVIEYFLREHLTPFVVHWSPLTDKIRNYEQGKKLFSESIESLQQTAGLYRSALLEIVRSPVLKT